MKFGKTFASHLTPEWRQQYMNYSDLNVMIRQAVTKAPDAKVTRHSDYLRERDSEAPLEEQEYYQNFEQQFFATCHQELSRVEDFFAQKLAEARRKLAEIKEQLGAQRGSYLNTRRTPRARQLGLVTSEFYLSLIMLQSFQNLNYTAFRKICKKYDKHIKSRRGALWFRDYVSEAPFTFEDELNHMIIEVEQLYTIYLTNGDRAKAMAKLRVPPLRQPASPCRVFISGILLGLFTVSAIIVLISLYYLRNQAELLAVFDHLYRGVFFWVLYAFYLSINVYVWQNVGINHVLIFDVDLRNHIPPEAFLELASVLGYICTMSMLIFLHHNEFGMDHPYHVPLACIVLPFVLLLNPIRICNYQARMWLIRSLGRILLSPIFYVKFLDFWLADQFNSLVLCLVDDYYLVRFYFRYYMHSDKSFGFEHDFLVPLIRCLPPWIRMAQCMRRYWNSDDRPLSYPLNALKYGTSILVVVCSTIVMETSENYDGFFDNPWLWIYIISYLISTVYSTTWDLIWDFGLLRVWKGENMFLRQQLIYPKWFYYFAMIANILIRCFWMLEIYLIANEILSPYNCKTIGCLCEITRRFIWNFLRLENEHLFNCGMFRATRDIFLSPMVPSVRSTTIKDDFADNDRGVQVNMPKKQN